MTRFSTNYPGTALASVLSLAPFFLFALTSTALASPKQQQHSAPKATHTAKKPSAPAKPKVIVKKVAALPLPSVVVISPASKPTREMSRPKPFARARQAELEPDDESTINVRLETGDEELDHTQVVGDDPITKIRAAQESNLGPRNGRTRNNSNLVSRALSYRGARYRFGATGSGGAFDCSGFVQHLMRTDGVSISRTAAEQFHGGLPVEREALQPGDLVFFQNTYKHGISHVGMYVGEGLFVHAASQKRGVVMDPLDLPYYNGKYAGARRYK